MNIIRVGDLVLDVGTYTIKNAASRKATAATYRAVVILQTLMAAAGTLVSREAVAAAIWSDKPRPKSWNDCLSVELARLQDRLVFIGLPSAVQKRHGAGWFIPAPETK